MNWKYHLVLVAMKIISLCRGTAVYNAAAGKRTTMSSTFPYPNSKSEYAVDGNWGTNFYKDGCARTNTLDYAPWWMIDLHGTYLVNSVVITNRNTQAQRLHSFVIEIFSQNPLRCNEAVPVVCYNYSGAPVRAAESRHFECEVTARGRFLRIRKWKVTGYDDALTLCEVEIYGIHETGCAYPKQFPRVKGKRLVTEQFELLSGVSLPECSIRCSKRTFCFSFNFQSDSLTCELTFNSSFSDSVRKDSQWEYYGSEVC